MPSGTSLLTESDIFADQVFKYGDNAYALQLHPEVMEPAIQKWTRDSVKRLQMPEAHLTVFASPIVPSINGPDASWRVSF